MVWAHPPCNTDDLKHQSVAILQHHPKIQNLMASAEANPEMGFSNYLPKDYGFYGEHPVMSPRIPPPSSGAPAIAATQDIFSCVPGH